MRTIISVLIASTILTGCNKAAASEPDSRNPAQCYAALNFGNYWLRKSGQHADKIIEGEARMLFEAKKAESEGRPANQFRADGESLMKAYGNARDVMTKLVSECVAAENTDPYFRENRSALFDVARAHPNPVR